MNGVGGAGQTDLAQREEDVGRHAGDQTLKNFPNATATAAMVPVWITMNRVQP